MIACQIRYFCEKQHILLPVGTCISIKKHFCNIGHDRNKHEHSKEKRNNQFFSSFQYKLPACPLKKSVFTTYSG